VPHPDTRAENTREPAPHPDTHVQPTRALARARPHPPAPSRAPAANMPVCTNPPHTLTCTHGQRVQPPGANGYPEGVKGTGRAVCASSKALCDCTTKRGVEVNTPANKH
jgi:hypothetical protein